MRQAVGVVVAFQFVPHDEDARAFARLETTRIERFQKVVQHFEVQIALVNVIRPRFSVSFIKWEVII